MSRPVRDATRSNEHFFYKYLNPKGFYISIVVPTKNLIQN